MDRFERCAASERAWSVSDSRLIYRGKWLSLREDRVRRPSGGEGPYAVVECPDNVTVVAITDESDVVMVREYVHPISSFLVKAPGGSVEGGEDLLRAAKRELIEEVGLRANEWIGMGSFYMSAGISSQASHLFLARRLLFDRSVSAEAGITSVRFSFEEIHKMCLFGSIMDGPTIVAVARARAYIESLTVE